MKTNKSFIYVLLIFFVISINSIYSFSSFLTYDTYSFIIRQACFYLVGIIFIFICIKIGPNRILKYSFFIYLFNVLILPVNNKVFCLINPIFLRNALMLKSLISTPSIFMEPPVTS